MIDKYGRVVKSVVDDCTNYNPDKDKPKGVSCVKHGELYECKNFIEKDSNSTYKRNCHNCSNRKVMEYNQNKLQEYIDIFESLKKAIEL